ncbi:hypothetical protein TBCG_02219 [Mycobacterium tuberculosis C]|nr:hypothetical protein TBCG_02219 [Mycobacterium tuberculosis C]
MNRHSTAASDRGLQAERTTLAWTRTAFALLVNGVLLTLKDTQGADGPAGLIPAGLAGAAASCCYVIALQRQRALSHRPLPGTNHSPRPGPHPRDSGAGAYGRHRLCSTALARRTDAKAPARTECRGLLRLLAKCDRGRWRRGPSCKLPEFTILCG